MQELEISLGMEKQEKAKKRERVCMSGRETERKRESELERLAAGEQKLFHLVIM